MCVHNIIGVEYYVHSILSLFVLLGLRSFPNNKPRTLIRGFLLYAAEVSCWMVTGERQAARIRGMYLKTILKQDITFFDTETSGEVIGRISGDTILIQEAMGEKVCCFLRMERTNI